MFNMTEHLITLNALNLLIFGFTLLIAAIAREFFQERDRVDPEAGASEIWHSIGMIMRVGLVLLIAYVVKYEVLWVRILIITLAVILALPIYNFGCALGAKRKFWKLSKKGFDLVWRKIFFWINFD